jgi:predicted hotdog family 3-hydroxylacyl-ACP dehydratase
VSMAPSVPLLDRAGIAERIPHAGPMCLLDALLAWDATSIRCRVVDANAPAHPLRDADGVSAAAGLELASQAMALHAGLAAPAGATPRPGVLASARRVRLHAARLDRAPAPLEVTAERLSGDDRQAIYAFAVVDADGRPLVDGRATVVLDHVLSAPPEDVA